MHTISARLDAAPHLNQVWAALIIEELVRLGVGLFCVAPGSRSTPLTLAAAAHPEANALVHFDERGSAFAALGYARVTRRPAVWITTSGTALANGMPAVVEASVDGVPLLLLTADRPPELRQTGANQTITQPGLFDPYVRWAFDLPTPSAEMPAAAVLTTVDQAFHRAVRAPGGPAHLNAMVREPLAPLAEQASDFESYLRPLARWTNGTAPFTRYAAPVVTAPPDALADLRATLRRAERGLVVAGRLRTLLESSAALRIAEALRWPLLADVESGLRTAHADHPLVIAHPDLVLSSAPFRATACPDAVLHLGGRPVSKRLAQHLAACAPPCYAVVRDDPDRFDPRHHITHRFESDLVAFADALLAEDVATADTANATADTANATADSWIAAWRGADDAVRAYLAHTLDTAASDEPLSEPIVARLVSQHRPPDHALVLAASMPIRDVDAFADPSGPAAAVFANRGASGIDGTVATAAGVALGRGAPATLLIGDLALLHDLNSLALLRDPACPSSAQPPVVIVAVNNDGGGIFHFLPLAREGVEAGVVPAADFERFFGTPHGLGFADAAGLFGLAYHAPTTVGGFVDAYRAACASGRSALIEVRTERTANEALHARLRDQIAAAVSATAR